MILDQQTLSARLRSVGEISDRGLHGREDQRQYVAGWIYAIWETRYWKRWDRSWRGLIWCRRRGLGRLLDRGLWMCLLLLVCVSMLIIMNGIERKRDIQALRNRMRRSWRPGFSESICWAAFRHLSARRSWSSMLLATAMLQDIFGRLTFPDVNVEARELRLDEFWRKVQ